MRKLTSWHTEPEALPGGFGSGTAISNGSFCSWVVGLPFRMVAAMVGALLPGRCSAGGTTTTTNQEPWVVHAEPEPGQYSFYAQYVTMFNQFRSQHRRHHLMFDAELNRIAARRAIEISQPGRFSHAGAFKYRVAENIAMMAHSSYSPGELLRSWAASPGHRSNMLSYEYRRTGFARKGKYAVQVFR